MSRRPFLSLASLMLLLAACSAGTTGPMTELGGAMTEDAAGSSASAGDAQASFSGSHASAGAPPSGGQSNNGGSSSGALGALGGAGAGAVSGSVNGGTGGMGTSGGGTKTGTGGSAANGGAGAKGGAAGGESAGAAGSTCPGSGHITYTLARSASPTATEQTAYDKIKTAMDKAISYYDCYTNITKSLKVSYVPSVETADGNSNGSMRFGMNTTYMDYRTAMHEIGHTVGIGQASNWGTFLAGGLFTGSHAAAQLKAINAKLTTPLYTDVHADSQHFWPYGINQQSEVKGEADLIAHCQMVVAIRQDLGL